MSHSACATTRQPQALAQKCATMSRQKSCANGCANMMLFPAKSAPNQNSFFDIAISGHTDNHLIMLQNQDLQQNQNFYDNAANSVKKSDFGAKLETTKQNQNICIVCWLSCICNCHCLRFTTCSPILLTPRDESWRSWRLVCFRRGIESYWWSLK